MFVFVQNIVLSGGSTMFKNFQKRLKRDIQKLVSTRIQKNAEKMKVPKDKVLPLPWINLS